MKTDLDALLKSALHSEETPDFRLTQQVKQKLYQEESAMQTSKKAWIPVRIIAAAAAVALLCTAALAAGVLLLRPGEVAQKFGDHALSAAFDSESAVNINETVTSGDYMFTLLAVVSGADLSDLPYGGDAQADRTYAVLAIQNADGTPMPDPQDEAYWDMSFMATPLVKGLAPWQVNIASLNGNYSETVVDGVMYRLIECDSVAMFADRGLYIGVCSSPFPDNQTFLFNEATGEISVNPDYEGASAVFDLLLDVSLADPEQAEEYLAQMFGTPDTDETAVPNEGFWEDPDVDWDQAIPVDSTFQELTADQDGLLYYSYDCEYGGGSRTMSARGFQWMEEGETTYQGYAESRDAEGRETITSLRITRTGPDTWTAVVVVAPAP